MSTALPPSQTYAAYDAGWLALSSERVIAPETKIVDAHHHLWDRPRPRYLAEDLIADVNDGHAVTDTVYVDCCSMYRADGPDHLRPLGEVAFANGVAAMGASGCYGQARLCSGIVGHVDLGHDEVEQVVDQALRLAGDRFKGVRQIANWDPDPAVVAPSAAKPRHLLRDPALDNGLAILADRGLSFDTFVYHHQLDDVAALAARHPHLSIVLDHLGAPLGIGRHAGRRAAIFAEWRDALARLAGHANVTVKIGGMGMRMFGFGFETRPQPPLSTDLAEAWAPYAQACVALFGPDRAMLESNFPPDKASCSYVALWNAFKRIFAGMRVVDRDALFEGTARRVYRLPA